ncbi:hypothetical protein [Nesterenkonia sp. PF2B19]|uniref:hypothetical protein n=1 Tax=Nesterenkonia sp. PF2B19 TaxID=1881858 RepID=UPI00111C3C00|nr:hypothetical protein [Nesterenkonia sp. PF2B19]
MASPGNASQSTADGAAEDTAHQHPAHQVTAHEDPAHEDAAEHDDDAVAGDDDAVEGDSDERPAMTTDAGTTALERFITEHLGPRVEELNAIPQAPGHQALLRRELAQRRITVREVSPHNHVLLFGGVVIGGFDRTMTSLVSSNARRVTRNKALTKRHFELQEIPVPAGRTFSENEITEAAKYLGSLSGPAVLKPASAKPGHGIATHLTSAEELQQAWPEALDARLTGEAPSRKLMVEQFHDGLDLRAFVVGEKLVSAIVRVPLHVVGDGTSEMHTLLQRDAARRQSHGHLAAHTPAVQEEDLAPMGLSLSTVLEPGRVVVLNEAANLRAGGIPVDVTDRIGEELAELAVDALWSIPGLGAAGIDLLAPDLDSAEGAVVLEADISASLVPHHCPAYGSPRNVAGAIADELLMAASR